MRTVLKRALMWGVVGFGLAVLFSALAPFTGPSGWEGILCPTSIAFMPVDKPTFALLDWAREDVFLIVTNFALYFVVGLIFTLAWVCLRKLSALFRSG